MLSSGAVHLQQAALDCPVPQWSVRSALHVCHGGGVVDEPEVWSSCDSPLSELPENWTDTRETLLEGMTFQLKYLGVTMVEQPKGEEMSAAAVKRIVATVSCDSRTVHASFHGLGQWWRGG